MLRLFLFLAVIVALATGLSWLADRPGNLVVNWEGYVIETSVFRAVVILALLTGAVLFVWSLLRHIWESPATIGNLLNRRRQKSGLDALSSGMIAIGAGDRNAATRYAVQARKTLPNEPLTHLLRAQAAQLSGDKGTARRIFEAMLSSPDTEQLGLRGLFLEAEKEGEREAAIQFAERAVELNPKLRWPVDALFELQCKSFDWAGALDTLSIARKNGHIDKDTAARRRAVLLTAKAQIAEDNDPERAQSLALEAHGLAPGLVPAAAIAGRLLASRGNTPKATKVIQKTWLKSPHPDLAVAYAYARLGDSPRDRLDRVKKLAGLNPYSLESPIAVASAAIDAKDYDAGRSALEPLLENRLTQRVCTLMARIEGEQHGDKGRVREWLARAVNAPRDPAWTADGVVSDNWAPVSPVTGALDAFQWRVPVEAAEKGGDELLARKLEELVALGAPTPTEMEGDGPIVDESAAVKGVAATTAAAVAPGRSAAAPQPVAAKPKPAPSRAAEDVAEADIIEPETTKAAATPAKPAAPAQSELSKPSGEPVADDAAKKKVDGDRPGAALTPPKDNSSEPASEAKSEAGLEVRTDTGSDADETARAKSKPASQTVSKPNTQSSDEGARETSAGRGITAAAAAVKGSTAGSDASAQATTKPADPQPSSPASKPAAGGGSSNKPAPTAATKPSASGPSGSSPSVHPDAPAETGKGQLKANTGDSTETRIFVSPRAPDDPGLDEEAPDNVRSPRAPYSLGTK